MKLLNLKKIEDGKYLKKYELLYENKAGREKKYEMISRREISSVSDLGSGVSGVSIVATCGDQLLLLKEFRMSINKMIFNLCAGMIEKSESIEDCIKRELFEETGLQLKHIKCILPPSYSAVAISDIKTNLAFVEVEGSIQDYTSENELIHAEFYSKEEVRRLLETEEFSSRSQIAAYYFAYSN